MKKLLSVILLVTLILGIILSYSLYYREFSHASADPTTLVVSVITYEGNVATAYDYMVVAAVVEVGGSPVSGALVTFSDSLGSTFMGSAATTNSSGVALTTVQFSPGNTGLDTINATASAMGYNSSIGSATVNVLAWGSTQLAVEPSITNNVATGGSTDVVSGFVVYAGQYLYDGMYTKGVAGATVTVTDTIGSTFSSATMLSDSNGFFSVNFTIATVGTSAIDLVTFGASRISYSSSQSTIMLQVAPYSASDLSVAMNAFFPSTMSTTYDYMVIGAEVTAGGVPVFGASVTFSDSLGSTFMGSAATTNSSGVALTTVQFNSGTTGIDVMTASASKSGFSGGVASNIVRLLAWGSTQLAVEPSITNNVATGGSTDVVSGFVVYAGQYLYDGMYTKGVAGATVTFLDTIGSIFNVTSVLTDSQGYFSASFTLPGIAATSDDIVMVSASEPGYSGSSTALYITATPGGQAVHDLVVESVVPHRTSVLAGDIVPVDIVVENRGSQAETFSVTGYYSEGKIGFKSSNEILDTGENKTVNMSWNTSGVMPGIYPIGAYVSLNPGGTDSGNSDYTDGTVTVLVSTSWNGADDPYGQGNYLSEWASGGNCYGFSSTAILYFMNSVLGNANYPYFPSQNPPATSTSKLVLPTQTDIWGNVDVLNNASLAVMFHQVYDPNCWYLVGPSYPIESTEYAKLVMTLENGIPALMNMRLSDGKHAHAVVAYAIQPLQDGTVNVTLSNPNYPQKWEMANYNPSTQVFSYIDPGGHSFNQFEITTPGVIQTAWVSDWDKSQYRFFSDQSWSWLVPGYDIILASKPISLESVSGTHSVDSFTRVGDSTSFVCGIPGSSGIEEGSVQVYAIPSNTPYTIWDPSANQTVLMISHVENVSGQLTYSEYFLNASTTLEALNFTVEPLNTGIAITARTNALNASVSFFYATEQNFSGAQVLDTLIEPTQTTNFTVENWQTINETGIQTHTTTIPEFPVGALSIVLTLPTVLLVALAAAVRKRKIEHPPEAGSSQESGRPFAE